MSNPHRHNRELGDPSDSDSFSQSQAESQRDRLARKNRNMLKQPKTAKTNSMGGPSVNNLMDSARSKPLQSARDLPDATPSPTASSDSEWFRENKSKSLQQQFSEQTRDNKKVQAAYKELWIWHDKNLFASEFKNYVMSGYLKKRVQELKFWQKKVYPKRHFILDFSTALIQVRHAKEDTKFLSIPFREVLDVYIPPPQKESKIKVECSKNYNFPFYLETKERKFLLFTATFDERIMWIAGFKYIIISTTEVQRIMDENERRMQNRIKKQERVIQANAAKELSRTRDSEKTMAAAAARKDSSAGRLSEGAPQFKSSAEVHREELERSGKLNKEKSQQQLKKNKPLKASKSERPPRSPLKPPLAKRAANNDSLDSDSSAERRIERLKKEKEEADRRRERSNSQRQKIQEQLDKIKREKEQLMLKQKASVDKLKQVFSADPPSVTIQTRGPVKLLQSNSAFDLKSRPSQSALVLQKMCQSETGMKTHLETYSTSDVYEMGNSRPEGPPDMTPNTEAHKAKLEALLNRKKMQSQMDKESLDGSVRAESIGKVKIKVLGRNQSNLSMGRHFGEKMTVQPRLNTEQDELSKLGSARREPMNTDQKSSRKLSLKNIRLTNVPAQFQKQFRSGDSESNFRFNSRPSGEESKNVRKIQTSEELAQLTTNLGGKDVKVIETRTNDKGKKVRILRIRKKKRDDSEVNSMVRGSINGSILDGGEIKSPLARNQSTLLPTGGERRVWHQSPMYPRNTKLMNIQGSEDHLSVGKAQQQAPI